MIYGNKFLGHNILMESCIDEDILVTEASNAKDITVIYTKYKAQIDENLKGSQQSFKDKNYDKVISYCNKTISICDKLIRELDKIQPEGVAAKIKQKKYINYANYMKQDATIAIGQAKLEKQK